MIALNNYPPFSKEILAIRRQLEQQDGLHCIFNMPVGEDFNGAMPRIPFDGMQFSALVHPVGTSPLCRICHGIDHEVKHYIEITLWKHNETGGLEAGFKSAPNGSQEAFIVLQTPNVMTQKDHYYLRLKYHNENNVLKVDGFFNNQRIGTDEVGKKIDAKDRAMTPDDLKNVFTWNWRPIEQSYIREYHWTCPTKPGESMFKRDKPLNPRQVADLTAGGLCIITGLYHATNTTDNRIGFFITTKSKSGGFRLFIAAPTNAANRQDITFEVHGGQLVYTFGEAMEKVTTLAATDASTRIYPYQNFDVRNVVCVSGVGLAAKPI